MARDAQARQDQAADLNLDLVALSRSGAGPYRVQVELPVPWIAARLAHTDAEIQTPGAVDIEVTLIADGASVLIRGGLDLTFTVPCARCLEPAVVPASGELCVHFVRGSGTDALRDEEDSDDVDADSPDQHTFSGNHLDLRPLVEEQILVAYPIRALCARGEACRGLCMHCGADLNAQPPASRCIACGNPDPRVPVVAAPGYEGADDEDTAAEAARTPGRKPGPATRSPAVKEEDSPWKTALRGALGDKIDSAGEPADPAARPAAGKDRKKPSTSN